jgi:hypothetical protein
MERFHMSAELPGLFEQLTPPPGGAERFARRLDELTAASRKPRRHTPLLAAAACAALALAAATVWLRDPGDSPPFISGSPPVIDIYAAPEFDRLLGRTRPPAEPTVRLGEQVAAVTQVETTNEKVRIYRID